MPRITITTNSGIITERIDEEDIGDLDKPMGAAALLEQIRAGLKRAHKYEAQDALDAITEREPARRR